MKVADVCRASPVTIGPFERLMEAARLMREKRVGYLIVVEPGSSEAAVRPVGVLTDRDVVAAVVASEWDMRSLRVNDVMTRNVVTVQAGCSLGAALREMRKLAIRRLPVVEAQDRLIGVLSVDDIVDALVAELESAAAAVRLQNFVEPRAHR